MQAIQQLDQLVAERKETGFAHGALLRRLSDEDWRVVQAALGCSCLASCPAAEQLAALKALLPRLRPAGSSTGPPTALRQQVNPPIASVWMEVAVRGDMQLQQRIECCI